MNKFFIRGFEIRASTLKYNNMSNVHEGYNQLVEWRYSARNE